MGFLFLSIAIPRIIFPDLDHGDEWADAEALNASVNYAKFGFIKTRFLPFFKPQLATLQEPYTHYPPLAQIINGFLGITFRAPSLRFYRSFSLCLSFLNLIFWYLFIKRLTSGFLISLLCAIFYIFNPFFIYGADSLAQISYADFLRSLILFVFIVARGYAGKTRRGFLLILWILVFLESLMTFEYIIYLSLFFILFKYLFKTKDNFPSWKVIFLLVLAPVIGFALHFLQNAWYFKSFSLALADFKQVAAERILHSPDAPMAGFNLSIWWKQVIARNFSLVFIFNYFILFLSIFFFYILYQSLSARPESRKVIKSLLRLCLILIICGVSWYVFFPAHSFAHIYVHFLVRHLLPLASVCFAMFFYAFFCYAKEKTYLRIPLKMAGLVLILGTLFAGINRSALPITPSQIRNAQDFLTFKECLLGLRKNSQEKDVVGINYFRRPFVGYYTDRNVLFAPDKPSLEKLVALPRYFIFIPYNTQYAAELFQFLNQKYSQISECRSQRFPSIFFELKS